MWLNSSFWLKQTDSEEILKRKKNPLLQKKNQFKAKIVKKTKNNLKEGKESKRKKRQTKTGKKFLYDCRFISAHKFSFSRFVTVDELKNTDRIE